MGAGSTTAAPVPLPDADLERLAAIGISAAEAARQLALFASPPPPTALLRPCTPGDGIARLPASDHPRLLALWREGAAAGRFLKFVPASGAATRMFSAPQRLLAAATGGTEAVAADDPDAAATREMVDRLEELPFFEELAAAGFAGLDRAGRRRRQREILAAMLDPGGLDLANRAKGLLPFHRYEGRTRSALEEHVVEASGYVAAGAAPCRLHLTVLARHRADFEAAWAAARPRLEAELGRRLELELSHQDPATDTLAVDAAGLPLRRDDGSLLLRPAGHGSLIGNLARLGGDVVFVKNIDNVAPRRAHELSAHWKRLLAGHLIELERAAHTLAARLEDGAAEAAGEAVRFLAGAFALQPPAAGREAAGWAAERLARPIRVCGVVPNAGEPGGGPFWVDAAGGASGQIVESGQVDRVDPAQRAIWESSTHFNPVDLVCALRDRHGAPHDLERWVDPRASFITAKTEGGEVVRALERPGLWNGAMAGWNTAFVEVPAATFTPVKTVLDLLRPEHCA